MSGQDNTKGIWLGIILMLNGAYFIAYGPSGMGYFLLILGIAIAAGMLGKRPTG